MSNGARRRKSGLRNVSNLRKLLREVGKKDSPVVKELRDALEESAIEIEQTMRFMAPRPGQSASNKSQGDLVRSISHTRSSDQLSYLIGPGVRGATTIKKRVGSYFATTKMSKGRRVNFSPRTEHDRMQLIKAYWLEFGTIRVRAYPFVQRTWDETRGDVIRRVDTAVTSTLKRIANKYGRSAS